MNKEISALFVSMLFALGVVSVPVSAVGNSTLSKVPEAVMVVPEFSVATVVLAFALAASLFILRRRRK